MGQTSRRLDLAQDGERTPSFNFLSQILHFTSPVPENFEVQGLPRPDAQSWLACNHLVHTASIHTFLHAIDPLNLLSTPAVMYRFLGWNSTGSV